MASFVSYFAFFVFNADAGASESIRDQLVKLTTVDPSIMVRITGITPEHGLLRTVPEATGYHTYRCGNYIDLQPDGNSFDLMAGLIKTKC